MGTVSLNLEPSWECLTVGDKVDVLMDVIIWDSHRSLCKTAIDGRFVALYGSFQKCPMITVLSATVVEVTKGIRLSTSDAFLLRHEVDELQMFNLAAETCSGMGCLGVGLESSGFTVTICNDVSKPICDFLSHLGKPNFHGNVGDPSAIAAIHSACHSSMLLAAGFSCQPWSKLGDQRRMADGRASSLDYILRCGFFVRAHSILLECVTSAGVDTGVQQKILEFCRITGYRQQCIDLHLSDVFPARRSRWFCVLTNPIVPPFTLRALPKLDPFPVVGDFLPGPCTVSKSDFESLLLDRYETGKYQAYGGLASNFVSFDSVLPTALHGWGNQLQGCPCGCRDYPMSEQRLQSRGLFAALFQVAGEYETYSWRLPCSRHIHPKELSCLHGMLVDLDWSYNPKLSLACLGQMASPIQSCWISAQLKVALSELQGLVASSPEEALLHHFRRFHASLVNSMPEVVQHSKFQDFCGRFVHALKFSHDYHAGPSMDPLCIDDFETQEQKNSQRRGRHDLLKGQTLDKQPASGKQEPENSSQQPAPETRVLEKQPADGTPGPCFVPDVSQCTQSPVHAMPASYHGSGPSPIANPPNNPVPSELFCAHKLHGGIPAFANSGVVQPLPVRLTSHDAHMDHSVASLIAPNTASGQYDMPLPSCIQQPADPTAKLNIAHEALGDRREPTESVGTTEVVPEVSDPGTFTQDIVKALHAMDEACQPAALEDASCPSVPPTHDIIVPPDSWAHLVPVGEPQLPPELTHSSALVPHQQVWWLQGLDAAAIPVDASPHHFVQIVHPAEDTITHVQVSKDALVGSLAVAESNLGAMSQFVRITDCVGCPLRSSSVTTPFQQIHMREM